MFEASKNYSDLTFATQSVKSLSTIGKHVVERIVF